MDPQTQNQTASPQGGSSYTATDGTQLNPTAVLLAKSIRNVESNGNYNAVGDNGQSHGAYQFNKDNFKNWASQYGLDPSDMSATNQDKVAYHRINDMLKSGNAPSEVAARWNGAKYVNGKYEAINSAYPEKVKAEYQKQLGGQTSGGPQLAPGVPALQLSQDNGSQDSSSQQPQEQGLGSQLIGRTNDAGQAISDTMSGKINPLSGLLQVGGAIGGGIGDIVNKGLELIPGVKQVEGLIGQGVGALAQTPAGQSVAKSIQNFSQAHPELSDDIGAGFNIATAIPIFDGLGAVKDLAMGGIGDTLQNVAKKSVVNGTEEAMSTGKALSKAFANNGGRQTVESAVNLLGKDAVPAIEGGKYATENAFNSVGDRISQIEENQLQPALKQMSTGRIADRQPIEDLRKQVLSQVQTEFKDSGQVGKAQAEVNRVFDDYKNSYGDYVTLEDINDMKRGIRKSVNFNSPKLESDVTYHIGQTLQQNIEQKAEQAGLPNINAINKQMGDLIRYQNMLKALDKGSAKVGKIRGLIQHAAGIGAGVGVGGMVGGGVAGEAVGGYVGNKVADMVGKRSVGGLTGGLLRGSEVVKGARSLKGLIAAPVQKLAKQSK